MNTTFGFFQARDVYDEPWTCPVLPAKVEVKIYQIATNALFKGREKILLIV